MDPKKRKIPKKISLTYLRNSGLYYLQRYVASTHQFERAMKRKIERSCYAHKDQDMEQCHKWLAEVSKEFQDLGYLNDEAFLTGMLRSLRLSKGLSQRMIVQKLRDKGFSEALVLPALTNLDLENERGADDVIDKELCAAIRFAERKKLGPYHPTPPRKTYNQQLSTLARAGFAFDICKKALEGGNFSE